MALKRGIEAAVEKIVSKIADLSKKIDSKNTKEVEQVATILHTRTVVRMLPHRPFAPRAPVARLCNRAGCQLHHVGDKIANCCSKSGHRKDRSQHGQAILGNLVNQLGKRVMLAEKTFNEAAGFTKAQDRLPEFFRNEKLPPFNLVYDVPQEEMDEFWDKVKSA